MAAVARHTERGGPKVGIVSPVDVDCGGEGQEPPHLLPFRHWLPARGLLPWKEWGMAGRRKKEEENDEEGEDFEEKKRRRRTLKKRKGRKKGRKMRGCGIAMTKEDRRILMRKKGRKEEEKKKKGRKEKRKEKRMSNGKRLSSSNPPTFFNNGKQHPSWSRWLGFTALTRTARVRVPDWESFFLFFFLFFFFPFFFLLFFFLHLHHDCRFLSLSLFPSWCRVSNSFSPRSSSVFFNPSFLQTMTGPLLLLGRVRCIAGLTSHVLPAIGATRSSPRVTSLWGQSTRSLSVGIVGIRMLASPPCSTHSPIPSWPRLQTTPFARLRSGNLSHWNFEVMRPRTLFLLFSSCFSQTWARLECQTPTWTP